MIDLDLSGKTILITGALGAIAGHIVRRLNAAGANLILIDIKAETDARQALNAWGMASTSYLYFSADVTDSSQLTRVIEGSFEHHPMLDTVLGHAGGCGLHPFTETSEATYERIFHLNYFAQTYLARAVLAQWTVRKIPGHLIFTSSYVARFPHTQISSYAPAKAALENFTRCLALEYAASGIRVNAISPGNVAAGSSLKVFDEDEAYRQFVLRISPMGKRNTPEAVADTFAFLCSPLAREINGQVLNVDFGVGIGSRL